MLTFVLFLFNRKEVKVFKGSKKQEQEKGTHLQRHLKELRFFFFWWFSSLISFVWEPVSS